MVTPMGPWRTAGPESNADFLLALDRRVLVEKVIQTRPQVLLSAGTSEDLSLLATLGIDWANDAHRGIDQHCIC